MKLVLGIDIGGTNTELGLVDKDGNIVAEGHTPTLTNQPVDNYLKALKEAMQSLIDSQTDCELVGVGIGAPNGNYYKGTIENAVNLGWGPNVPLLDLLKESFDVKTWALTNDANAAAVGEMIFGGALFENRLFKVHIIDYHRYDVIFHIYACRSARIDYAHIIIISYAYHMGTLVP